MTIAEDFWDLEKKQFYLYKNCDDSEGALNIFKEGSLKFTQPKNFNDPFDSYALIDSSFLTSAKDQPKFKKLYFQPNFKEISTKLFGSHQNNEELVNFVRDKAYIFCLNANPLNHLMWSHYAKFHKGFLIEFKFPMNLASMQVDNFHPMIVDYVEEYPEVTGQVFQNSGDTIRKIFLQKSKEWEYEKECRILRYGEFDTEFQNYDRAKYLSSVTAGICCSDEYYKKLEEVINRMNTDLCIDVKLYKTEKVPNKYGITVPNHPRLDVVANSKKKK